MRGGPSLSLRISAAGSRLAHARKTPQFIAEILPFVSQLNGMQMSSILMQVRDLTVRPRRSA
jgi:hypothetical protein